LYPQLLEDREAFKQRFGRSRVAAIWAGLLTLLRRHRQLRLSLELHSQTAQMRTLTLFVGNNPLQMERLGIPLSEGRSESELTAIALRPVGRLAMGWLLIRGALGQLGDAENVHSFEFDRLNVKPSSLYRTRRVKVATDGEVLWLTSPLTFRAAPQPLYLLKPVAAASAAEPEGGPA
jgi:diacylglycerol kinase family enzyme